MGLLSRAASALTERGAKGVLTYAPHWVAEKLRRHHDGWFDRRYGTQTSGNVQVEDLAVESENRFDAIRYEPVSPFVFRQALRQLGIDFRRFVFIDFGSGKGRPLLMASQFPFKRIIGVEFARELHEIAERNIALFSKQPKQCGDIEPICVDATVYELPLEPLVLFFYSPFKPRVLKEVLDRIDASVRAHPREVVVIFHGTNPESIVLFERPRWNFRELRLWPDLTRRVRHRTIVCNPSA